MTTEPNENIREIVQAHFDDSITKAEAAKLREWLESDPSHMDEFVRQLMLHTSLYEKYAQEASMGTRPRVVRRSRARRLVPIAAALALTLTGLFVISRLPARSGVVARVVEAGEGAVIVRGTKEIAARAGSVLLRGDGIRTDPEQRLSLTYEDGKVEANMEGETIIEIRGADEGRIVLTRGRLGLDVAGRPMGRPFVVQTPQAQVDVLGTRFQLSVSHKATRLDMNEGTARLVHLAGNGASQKVYRWGYGYAREGLELLVFPPEGKAKWVKTVRKFSVPVPAPRGPGIAYDGSSLWLTGNDPPALFRVDPNDGRILQKLDLSGEFRSIGNMTRHGERLLINGTLHTTYRGSEMCLVDPSTGKIAGKLPSPAQLEYISAFTSMTRDEKSVWVVLPRGGRIDRVNIATGATMDVRIVRHPEIRTLTCVEGAFWTIGRESLYKMNRADMRVVEFYRNADVHEFCDITGAGGTRLWIADRTGTVVLVDVAETSDEPSYF